MVRAGMMEELEEWFQSTGTPASTGGLMKAIGVPEFARYESGGSLEACVGEIKENTRVLAERQRWKIRRFGQEVAAEGGLKMHRVDATAAFAAAMMMGPAGSKSESTEIWEKEVLQPSRDTLKDFLSDVIISSEKQKQYALREHII
ncbi:unnamed protein product [Cuscuta epithymum]|uniref:Uncharacterized protein n=1 Tax=Cuscuta epithymum TaxID=186058 RepID=A0AAV0GIK6_9ASTE|nr:unnamed protein product [Cuscuta epithymum]